MNSPEKPIYRFEDVEVNLLHSSLKRGEQERHLRRKAFQVLVYLLEQRERLVTKDELIEFVWRDTAVTDDAIVQCIKEIRRTLGDNSHQPRFIKTVPKVGYRFISPVENINNCQPVFIQTEEITRVEVEFEEELDLPAARQSDFELRNADCEPDALSLINPPPEIANRKTVNTLVSEDGSEIFTKRTRRFSLAAVSILIAVSVLTAFFYFIPKLRQSERSSSAVALPQTPGKKTIAVMYFENQSNSAELDWLREGLADMLITNLSRSSKLTILSRAQLYLLLEKTDREPHDKIGFDKALEIARKAQAAAFITGSFARIGEKVRLDVQLYGTDEGSLQSAESLTVDKPEQILTEIDLLSLKLTNRLGIVADEQQGGLLAEAMTDNLEAYRYYSLAVEKSQALHSKEAIELLEKAVALDSDFAMAYARIGYTYAVSWGLAEKGKPYLERAFRLSERLTEKDRLQIAAWYAIANLDYAEATGRFREIIAKFPTETEAYVRLGRLLTGEGQTEEAINVLKQGLSVDPEAKNIYNVLGGIYSGLNRHAEAIAMGERYVALAPHEANAFDSLGLFYQQAGDYRAAAENYNRALELKPNFEIALIHLGNVYFQTGHYNSAIDSYKKYIQIAPSENERARGYSYISTVCLKKNNLALAEKAAVQAFQNNKESIWDLYVITSEQGNAKKAAKYEEQLFAKPTSTSRGARHNGRFEFYSRGYIALKSERSEEAVNNFKEVLRHLPLTWNIEDFEDSLANAYLRLERNDEAIAEYERILRLNANYPLARFHLAQAYERKGQITKARVAYEQFLQTWKDADTDIPEIITARKFIGKI